jgi:hypothetical protein
MGRAFHRGGHGIFYSENFLSQNSGSTSFPMVSKEGKSGNRDETSAWSREVAAS